VVWLELTLRLRAEALPRAEAILHLAGAASIAISDDSDSPILEPEPGTTPLWPKISVRALFDERVDQSAIIRLIGTITNDEARFKTIGDRELDDKARQTIHPVDIGPRLRIVPAESLETADERVLGLHMGLAFGTGQHPTTRLCLHWLEREMPAGTTVLDYGTGSGVLALAALKLGADHATAIDVEPQALTATRRNTELNGLKRSISIGPPEMLDMGHFDLIVANILARPLIDLADAFAERQPAGGHIILSGVLISQIDDLESRYATWYEAFERHELAGWGLLTARRRSGYDR